LVGQYRSCYLTSRKLLETESTKNPIATPTKAAMNNIVNVLSRPQNLRIEYSLVEASTSFSKYESSRAIERDTDQYPLMRFQ
jgi:hypothetical protein